MRVVRGAGVGATCVADACAHGPAKRFLRHAEDLATLLDSVRRDVLWMIDDPAKGVDRRNVERAAVAHLSGDLSRDL